MNDIEILKEEIKRANRKIENLEKTLQSLTAHLVNLTERFLALEYTMKEYRDN